MHGKLMFVAGAAIGYVIGARKGRVAYDQLARRARTLWNDARVRNGLSQAQQSAREKVPGFSRPVEASPSTGTTPAEQPT